jgi:hypothetical protein
MNNSTALFGVVKGRQLGLKETSIPDMELLLFYKKGKQTPTALLVPCFFLLCHRQGEKLGVTTYEERINRKKRDALQIGDWKDDESPPE